MEAGIFDAAIRLFDERGYDTTSIEDVCAEAQVGRATFFRYFETKSGLIREVDRRVAAQIQVRLDATATPSLTDLLPIIADTLHDTWATAGLGLQELGRASTAVPRPSRRVFADTLEVVVEAIVAARRRGDLASELPPQLIAVVVLVQLTGTVSWWLDNRDADLRSLLDRLVEHCLHGYSAPVAAAALTTG